MGLREIPKQGTQIKGRLATNLAGVSSVFNTYAGVIEL